MRDNFGRCLRLVLVHEGGYVDHPEDPGGATNRGITLATFRGYFGNNRLTKDDLRNITEETIGKIYRERYWMAVKGDDLPLGLDYAVFDFGVNSGPSRAVKFLQKVIGTAPDGAIGPDTMLRINGFGARQAIVSLCASRLTWLQGLKTWKTFGRGWGRRVTEVEGEALRMAGVSAPARPAPSQPIPAPIRPERKDEDPEEALAPREPVSGWDRFWAAVAAFFARLKGQGR